MTPSILADSSLNRIKEILIETVHPKQIILFGSRARGDFHSESDYDLLLVLDSCENERTITRTCYRTLLSQNISTPIDLIAVSSEKLKSHENSLASVYASAIREGVTIYG